jgi:pyruvate,water dikinase
VALRDEPTDTLAQSVPHNAAAEIGLALLDVAALIRPHPQVVAFLNDA